MARLTFARRFLNESIDHYRAAARYAATPDRAAQDLLDAADCAHAAAFSGHPAFDLLQTAARQARAAGDGDTEAVALARAVEMACRFPAGFRSEIPYDELCRLLDRARTAAEPHRPVVAARLACAAAWAASRHKITPDPVLADTALATARATGDPVLISAALDAVAGAAARAGRLRDAHRLSGQRLTLLAAMDRNDPYAATEIVDTYEAAFSDALECGDLPAASVVADQFTADDLVGGHAYRSASLTIPVQALTGDLTGAVHHAHTMWTDWDRAGRPSAWRMPAAAAAITLAYGLLGDRDQHTTWRTRLSEVAASDGTGGARLGSTMAFIDARTAVHTHTYDDADSIVERAFADHPRGRYLAYARATAAELAVVADLPDAAQRLAQATEAATENDWAAACLARATGRQHRDQQLLAAAIDTWNHIGARLESAVTQLLLPAQADHGRAMLTSLGLPLDRPGHTRS